MEKTNKLLYRTTSEKRLKRGYIDTENGQIHFGTAGYGPALMMIHQSSSSMEEYTALIPFLADNYQLIFFDLPGHGHSDDYIDEPGVEEFTQAAFAVISHLKIAQCSVLGHHGGALMAMNFAYRFPSLTHKVILSGTSGIKTEEEKIQFSQQLANKKKVTLEKDGQSLLLAWQRYVAYMPEASLQDVLRPFLNSIMTRIRPYDAHHAVLKWDRQPALESLKMAVLLIQGDQDEFVSRQENLLDILPNAQRQIIHGGAFLFFDQAKECSEIIQSFLADD